MNNTEAWEKLKATSKGLGVSLAVYILVVLFRPSLFVLLCCLVVGITSHYLYSTLIKKKKAFIFWELIKKVVGLILIVLAVYLVYYLTGSWGLWSTIIVVIMLSTIILIRRRKEYLEALRHIETMIFKKPLDKKNFVRKRK